jgi:hypothetical protein
MPMHLTGASRWPKTSTTLPRQVMVSFAFFGQRLDIG